MCDKTEVAFKTAGECPCGAPRQRALSFSASPQIRIINVADYCVNELSARTDWFSAMPFLSEGSARYGLPHIGEMMHKTM